MWLMLQQDTPDDYVVATGRSTRSGILPTCIHLCRAEFRGSCGHASDLMRPAEVDILLGDASKARQQLVGIRTVTLEDMIDGDGGG